MKEDLKVVLQERAEQVSAAAALIMAKTADWQMIKQYLCNRINDFELTATQKEKMERYQFMYNQLVSGKYTDSEVVNQTMNLYHLKSQSQAYEDLSATREIFNSVININKQFELNLALQHNRNYMRKCEEAGNMKALAAHEKNRIALIKELKDMEDNRGELFEGHTFEMTFDPTLLGAPAITKEDMKELLTAINAKRDKKIKVDMFDELEYQNVKDGSQEASS